MKKNVSESAVNELGRLKSIIESGEFVDLAEETEEWGGADLVVTSDPERAGEFTSSGPTITIGPSGVSVSSERYTVVLTDYARELSWLIERLSDSLQGYVTEFISKYEFYAILGQAANKYLSNTPRQAQNAKNLLLAVLSQAEDLLCTLKTSFS